MSAAGVVPDDVLYEVVDGQMVEKDWFVHEALLAQTLAGSLWDFAKANRQGKVFILMLYRIDQSKNLQRRPDISFVSNSRWPWNRRLPDVESWDMVPDLAVEITNSNDKAEAVNERKHEYFEAGVRQVWVVYPDYQEVYVYSSTKQLQVFQVGDEMDGGELLPGFRLPLAALFDDEPEAE